MTTLPKHILKDIFEMKKQIEKYDIHPNVKYDENNKIIPHPIATIVKKYILKFKNYKMKYAYEFINKDEIYIRNITSDGLRPRYTYGEELELLEYYFGMVKEYLYCLLKLLKFEKQLIKLTPEYVKQKIKELDKAQHVFHMNYYIMFNDDDDEADTYTRSEVVFSEGWFYIIKND